MQSDVDDLPPCFPSHTQFFVDNVHHQTVTLDGCGSFHGMGVISMTTPCSCVTGGHFSKPVIAAVTRVRRVTVDRIIINRVISFQLPLISRLHHNVCCQSFVASVKWRRSTHVPLNTACVLSTVWPVWQHANIAMDMIVRIQVLQQLFPTKQTVTRFFRNRTDCRVV